MLAREPLIYVRHDSLLNGKWIECEEMLKFTVIMKIIFLHIVLGVRFYQPVSLHHGELENMFH